MVDLEPILQKYTISAEAISGPVPSYVVAQHIREMAEEIRAAASTEELCPVCAAPFKPDDLCATDIELGICHAACLEGSPTVDLETGEPTDGPISTYLYGPDVPVWLLDLMSRWPLGTRIEIDHDGFRGSIVGYYRRHDGKCGAVLQIDGGRIIHVYGEQWLKRAEGTSNV